MRSRRSVRLAAVGTAALVAGVLPGTNSVASGGGGELSLAYVCQFASGEQDVTVAFTQAFPPAAAVGKPISPGGLKAAVTIPRAGVAAMLPDRTVAVTADGDLTTRVTQGTSAVDTDWPGLRAPAVQVAGTDDLVLTLAGKVPGVSVTAAGDVAFSAGPLALTLHPVQAPPSGDGGSTATPSPQSGTGSGAGSGSGSGSGAGTAAGTGTDTASGAAAASPAVGTAGTPGTGTAPSTGIAGTCTPASGQDATLATVHVPATPGLPAPGRSGPAGTVPAGGRGGQVTGHAPATGATRSGAGSADHADRTADSTIVPLDTPVHSHVSTCGTLPTGSLDPKWLPPVSDTATVLPQPGDPPFPPSPYCGFAVGYSNVKKLDGAMLINDPHAKPTMAEINSRVRLVLDYSKEYIELDSILALNLPTSHSAFLTYGFMPTTADVQFVPHGVFTVVQTGDDFFNEPILTTIAGYQDIRISNVRINGTPLDVGPNCHTAKPVEIVMHGRKDAGLPDDDGKPDYFIDSGGPLTDENLVVPPFTGCASHGENLDALFTASLSGPGNSLNIEQGPLCDPVSAPETTCQPEIRIPQLPQRKKS